MSELFNVTTDNGLTDESSAVRIRVANAPTSWGTEPFKPMEDPSWQTVLGERQPTRVRARGDRSPDL